MMIRNARKLAASCRLLCHTITAIASAIRNRGTNCHGSS